MAIRLHYFDYFPTVNYDIDKDNSAIFVTDIMHRFKLREKLKNKTVLFHTYDIKGGERPEHVARRFYNRPKLDWLILITNEILDAQFEWPMDHWQLQAFVTKKYGSLSDAHQTIHHYEKIIDPEQETASGIIIPEVTILIDETEYDNTIDVNRKSVSMYEYEKNLNESRRTIKIIHESYIPQILREADSII